MEINGAVIASDAYRTDGTAVVWHNDGMTCDGTAAMFGATAGAIIQDITLVNPVINVSGDYIFDGEYCYAAAISAFDMESVLNNVNIKNASIHVDTTEESAKYRSSLYASVGGMVAGGWNTIATNCTVSGEIKLNTETVKSHGGYIFLGGLIGECYATMNGCNASDLQISLNSSDLSTASEDISLEINVGGYAGSQLYLTADNNTVTSQITTNCDLDEAAGELNVGSVAGRIDVFYMLQILQYTPIASTGATGNTANVVWNGQPVETIIAGVPQIDGVPVGWINNGDYEITEGYTAPSNIEAIIEAYGSAVPQSNMMPGIVWVTID